MIVSFIGHRTVNNIEQIKCKLKEIISNLIVAGADVFLFGSRSEFDNLCWSVVTALQTRFPNIKRIKFNTPHETAFTSQKEKENCERLYTEFMHKKAHYADYEEAIACEKTQHANRTAYIIRNQEMIDRSDLCVFYYDKNYLPPKRKRSKRHLCDYQPKSGTAMAFAYAKRKNKQIINLFSD